MLKLSGKLIALLIGLSLQQAALAQNVTIFAAASLSESVSEIATAYNKHHQTKLTTVFAASSTLARQISRGAPADIFISANQKWMNYLIEQKKVTKENSIPLLQNSLVVATPINSTIVEFTLNSQTDLKKLLAKGRLATGNTDHVPVGIYAKQALLSLGLWDDVKRSLALSSNTRAALAFIERKAVPLGIVYKTDALASSKVKIAATIPLASHEKILYPLAMIERGNKTTPQNISVYQFFQSDTAIAIFKQYGFETSKNVN